MEDSLSLSFGDLALSVRRFPDRSPRVLLRIGDSDHTTVVMPSFEACQLAARLVQAAQEAIPPEPRGALTPDEFRLMVKLLHQYAESELDQWDAFSVTTGFGPVYLMFTRSVADTDAFTSLDGFLADPSAPRNPAE